MHVATYVRVSTSGQTLASQIHALNRYADARGFTIREQYQDQISGTRRSRPGLDKLMDRLPRFRAEGIAGVVVYKLDRLSRGGIFDLIQTALLFQGAHVDLISATEPIDTSTPIGRLFFSVMACLGEIERETISERVVAGIEAARAAGKQIGRPRVVVPEEDLRAMVDLRVRGVSWSKIRREMDGRYKVSTIRNRVNLAIAEAAVARKAAFFAPCKKPPEDGTP